ncbi:hypothetical protein Y032_0028g1786 [Ancylostoma ceylanicum]|uniref:Uncharacterized protein n=1 Tax=Ancylostoma ceylanicum TaxID=53326 RepID=A0A016US88_9BILA|nr:hypothetical protein Y032_0028g1786 [Ancylostoma ceylanicum]
MNNPLYNDQELVQMIALPTKVLERELRNSMSSLDILEKTEAYTEASRRIIELEKTRVKEKIRKLRAARAERMRLHLQ